MSRNRWAISAWSALAGTEGISGSTMSRIGTGRLLPEGKIGRMAVVKEWRRRGIGADLLEALVAEARRRGLAEVKLSAQLQAAEFYRAHGFVAEGKVYEEAGILHQAMRRSLK